MDTDNMTDNDREAFEAWMATRRAEAWEAEELDAHAGEPDGERE